MRKKSIFILSFFLNFLLVNSQSLFVKDVQKKDIIPFANYFLFLDSAFVHGGYCSDNGKINIPKDILFNKIKVTSLGYENLEVLKNNLSTDTLLLTPTVYPLKEVIIKASKKEEFTTLGYSKSKRKSHLSASKGRKICTFVDNPLNEPKIIHSFLLRIGNLYPTKVGFKLHLFEKDTITNTPGKELLQQEIIVILDGKSRKLIDHDVSRYNIEFPAKGAFVGIEWFGVLNEENSTFKSVDFQNGYIELNDVSENCDTFQQDVFSFYPWKNMERFKDKVKEDVVYKNCPTASFGIIIYKD
ncbi:hypothetical protein WFZ85_07960 [Flavobacterium sp. j3]|uniref:PEGA domain-containing protein n=1 Tax=Flavobacterium aureirubrum TaxID=3133147 RepID=A0ABU9N4A0_9FLAO